MPIADTDLIAYAALNQPEDEVSTAGGAIDPDTRVVFTDLAVNDDVEVVSDNAGDTTQQITVRARNSAGVIVSEQVTLTGLTPVVLSTMGVVQRILDVVLDSDAAGVVTVRRQGDAGDIADIPAGERGFTRLFIDSFSDPDTAKEYHAKLFLKNAHGSLSLLNAQVLEEADPSGLITFTLEDAQDDSGTVADRLTEPSEISEVFSGDAKNVPGTNIAAGSAIGVWLKLSLSSGNAPIDDTYTIRLTGQST